MIILQSLRSLFQTSSLWKPQESAGPIDDLPPPSQQKKSPKWKCFATPIALVKRRFCQSKV